MSGIAVPKPMAGGGDRGRRGWGLSQAHLARMGLVLVVLLGAGLRCVRLGADSIGNAYYAATVRSMLTSWHNFLFAAFEPGGSVTVDKPPVGFWVQAASAAVWGVNGFALALPQALAGVLSILLLYDLVKRQFGPWAGLVAALALAVTPVAVSTERNNTVDGLLVFVLLLAARAWWRATLSGRLLDLLLGAALVGLAFNVKMLQAFLPLPAFYLLYLAGARLRWRVKLGALALATVVLVIISLSWAVAVDLTPPEARPYIGSSENNTVMELIVGHNGIARLGFLRFLRAGDAPPLSRQGTPALGFSASSPGGQPGPLPPGGAPDGTAQPPRGGPRSSGTPGIGPREEVGDPGLLRLVSEPLAGEAGWLLPLGLLGLPLAAGLVGWRRPLLAQHLALVLWAGWLLPEVVTFTLNSGLWHAYYLIMLGPPLAALIGITVWAFWRVIQRWRGRGLLLFAVAAGITLRAQAQVLWVYNSSVFVAIAMLCLSGVVLLALALSRRRQALARAAFALAVAALMVGPLAWSGLTTLNANPNVALPRSGPATVTGGPSRQVVPPGGTPLREQTALLAYLLAHYEGDGYLVAGLSSHDVSGYIIETGLPALAIGGFGGNDDVVTAEELRGMVAAGELRFVVGGPELTQRKPEIGVWVTETCRPVHDWQVGVAGPAVIGSRQALPALYDCGYAD